MYKNAYVKKHFFNDLKSVDKIRSSQNMIRNHFLENKYKFVSYIKNKCSLHVFQSTNAHFFHFKLYLFTIESFHKHHLEIDLTQACVGELNTILRGDINYPIIYGVGVNIKTGEIFPATFLDRGPDRQLRDARNFMGAQSILDIYDSSLGMLRIGPFNYDPLRGVDLWLSQTDEFLLQHLSTSPDVEPPHFTMQIRATIKFIQDNQFPAITVFRDNRPRYYRRDESTGCWTLVND